MLTGKDRTAAYQAKYPGLTLKRRSKRDQEAIRANNKRMINDILKANKDNRREKIRQSREATADGIAQVVKRFNNRKVMNAQEADRKVAELID